MQGGQKRSWLPVEQRERVVVEMEVQKVEFLIVAFLSYAFQHHHMQRVGIANGSVEAQRLWPCRVKFRRGLGIAAGEQRDIISKRYQFLGQPVYHPFGATIQFGGNSLRQRGNLRNAHLHISFVIVNDQNALWPRWHRHAETGTFSHLRSSLEQAYFFHITVLLMPSRPVRSHSLSMRDKCCGAMASRRQLRSRLHHSIV